MRTALFRFEIITKDFFQTLYEYLKVDRKGLIDTIANENVSRLIHR